MSLKRISFALFILLAICIGIYPMIYGLVDMSSKGLLATKPEELLASQSWRISFYLHIGLGGLSLLVGWPQFVKKWREERMALHRLLGKIYILAVLISGLTGLFIAQYASGGIIPILGFTMLALLWLWTTGKAYLAIRKTNVAAHQRWMIRSFALTFAAVTLRIWLPLLTMYFEGDFFAAYRIVAWLCWVPNIFVAEWIIKRMKKKLELA
jgi:uncharacterized membrane protein